VFNVVAIAPALAPAESMQLAEEPADYAIISEAGMNSIDRAITAKSRGIAQRLFRGNLLRLWQGSCAVTSVQEPRVLRSSHIKTVEPIPTFRRRWTISTVYCWSLISMRYSTKV
jgi:hypothetical protein